MDTWEQLACRCQGWAPMTQQALAMAKAAVLSAGGLAGPEGLVAATGGISYEVYIGIGCLGCCSLSNVGSGSMELLGCCCRVLIGVVHAVLSIGSAGSSTFALPFTTFTCQDGCATLFCCVAVLNLHACSACWG